MKTHFVWLWILMAGLLMAQSPAPTLEPFTQMTLPITADFFTYRFVLEAEADSVWSFSAASPSVDAVLRLRDANENILLANDNETRRSWDARLENWVAPSDGQYILEVGREGGAEGRTSGELTLTVLADQNSVALSPLPIQAEIELLAGRVFELIPTINPRSKPITLRFSVELAREDNFALQMITSDPQNMGDWLLVLGESGGTLQQTQQNEESSVEQVLWNGEDPFGSGDYRLELTPETLRIWYGEGEAFVLDASTLGAFRFLQGQSLRILAMPRNSQALILQNPYASTPFYTEQTLQEALPPALERLYDYDEFPLAVVGELRERGYLDLGGGLALTIPSGIIETGDSGFSSTPIAMAGGFEDFVLSFRMVVGAGNPACGVTFRQEDAANFSAVLLSALGNAYILPYQNGELLPQNLALQSPWINQGLGAENAVLLLVRGETAQLFINGYAVETSPIPRQRGEILLTLVNENGGLSRCTFGNMWVWSLDVD